MRIAAENKSVSFRLRSRLSWPKVIAWAAFFTALIFAMLNWRGCWFFRYGIAGSVSFLYVFSWMTIFFALGPVWRAVLFAATLVLGIPVLGLHGLAEENAGPESAAVGALHQIGASLRAYHEGQGGYPNVMPSLALSPAAQKFYRYEYVTTRSSDGRIVGYLLRATPARRDCDFHRSFTMTQDGRIFWTLEPRPATTADHFLDE